MDIIEPKILKWVFTRTSMQNVEELHRDEAVHVQNIGVCLVKDFILRVFLQGKRRCREIVGRKGLVGVCPTLVFLARQTRAHNFKENLLRPNEFHYRNGSVPL